MKCLTCQEEVVSNSKLCERCLELFRKEKEMTTTQYSFVWVVWGASSCVHAEWHVEVLQRGTITYASSNLPETAYSFTVTGEYCNRQKMEEYAETHWKAPKGLRNFRDHAIKMSGYRESVPVYVDQHWGPDGPDLRHPALRKDKED